MPEVKKFLDGINQTLLPWQEYVLTQLLAVDKKEKFKKKTSLLLVARQSGKTHLARIRILAGLFVFGEKNIGAGSAQRLSLAILLNGCVLVQMGIGYFKNEARFSSIYLLKLQTRYTAY